MKKLKIEGIIIIPDEMNLNSFCEKFNEFQDKQNCDFSGFVKDIEEKEDIRHRQKEKSLLAAFFCTKMMKC